MSKGKKDSRILAFFKKLGPGLITGASDDDPSGIATYSQAGAQFGLSTLWTALLTFPLMAAIQGMCARIGLVTAQGLTVTLKKHYSKPILYGMLLFSFPAITLNIGADIQGMGAVAHMIFPRVPVSLFSILVTAILLFIIIRYPYQKIAMILKWLCLSLLLYIIVPFMVGQDWIMVAKKTFIPTIRFDKEFLSIIVAILGTTISPYLFFWQTTMEAEDQAHKGVVMVNKRILSEMKTDVNMGMLLSNMVMFFMILTTGTVLFTGGIHKIDTVDQAAKALEPLAGKLTYFIFASGVLGTGMLAIPVLAGSQSYMLAETFGWKAGLDKKFSQAKPFYGSIIVSLLVGLSLDFFGVSPIKALLYTAIVYGLTAPVMIAVIMHIANNEQIMGEHTNSRFSNILGLLTLVLMTAAAAALIYFLF
ncbi:divalent metal cation transporter [Chryseobacterium indologenes]|uniref:NRAMP family divalent metal transporter n=1 Tax=Chryseobacterium TaxID=59732 RepID=UPI000F4FE303|nr:MULTISPECIES: divalent metal cation transporter [Chryseobacterium]AYZ36127.1 divalent metal cation transporter [Chryseobacterium indologenes]MEB4760756.1 divalent metal cation transporter [Chryseobacterium indologenes]RQO40147.1 iron transporter [Chryseobacterium sp. KBW03]